MWRTTGKERRDKGGVGEKKAWEHPETRHYVAFDEKIHKQFLKMLCHFRNSNINVIKLDGVGPVDNRHMTHDT